MHFIHLNIWIIWIIQTYFTHKQIDLSQNLVSKLSRWIFKTGFQKKVASGERLHFSVTIYRRILQHKPVLRSKFWEAENLYPKSFLISWDCSSQQPLCNEEFNRWGHFVDVTFSSYSLLFWLIRCFSWVTKYWNEWSFQQAQKSYECNCADIKSWNFVTVNL